ncbi:putative acetyltransferase [Actinacidiphila reveromycinica]|uniref:Putative acetyltransferase n=1 Tax=Actinacidiphila reveromycinica TaxID=659352 RepID=A0A7U3VPV9_9ACTN|nr:GNAT family protein [Streptomyces sp. SN-593]BBA99084.1 putative acetyltransferase [Streptomyces sp. SN-593]
MAFARGADLLAPTTLRAHGLLLRPVVAADEPAVARAMADPGVLRWAAGMAVIAAPPRDRAAVWLSARVGAWSAGTAAFAVTDPADDVMIGYLGLRDVHRTPDQAVAGYWVTPSARGRQVTARALDAASAWAFEPPHAGGLGLHRIHLDHVLHNVGSCRAALRAGFAEEGVMRDSFIEPDGTRHDCHLHARLATDPPARPFA